MDYTDLTPNQIETLGDLIHTAMNSKAVKGIKQENYIMDDNSIGDIMMTELKKAFDDRELTIVKLMNGTDFMLEDKKDEMRERVYKNLKTN